MEANTTLRMGQMEKKCDSLDLNTYSSLEQILGSWVIIQEVAKGHSWLEGEVEILERRFIHRSKEVCNLNDQEGSTMKGKNHWRQILNSNKVGLSKLVVLKAIWTKVLSLEETTDCRKLWIKERLTSQRCLSPREERWSMCQAKGAFKMLLRRILHQLSRWEG